MPNFIWTLIYLFVALWAITRLLAWLLQWCLKHYLDVQVKVGQIGLFRFTNVQAVIKQGLNVEIGQVWLSSCFVNPEIRKPLVLCIQEVRIQANIENVDSGRERVPSRNGARRGEERERIPRWLPYVQFIGIRVENLTMMLLKTMLPDSLIHIEGQEISIDSTITDDSLNLALNLSGVTCKALKSLEGSSESSSDQCLSEIAVSIFTEITVTKIDPQKLQVVRFLVSKPQMMITEGFLQSLQLIHFEEDHAPPQSRITAKEEKKLLDLSRFKCLKEISFDCSELNVKILREKKQRSLSVGLTLFHLGFHNESKDRLDLSCNIVLDDFQTSSSQARFAGVTKVEHKIQIVRDHITTVSLIRGGYFHYHHDEIQYWTTVLYNILENKKSQISYRRLSTATPPPSTFRSSVLEWLSEKKVEYEIQLFDLSSTLSSASCSGLHAGMSSFKISGNIKPTIGVDSNYGYLVSHDLIFEAEINCVYCWHIDAGVSVDLLGKKKHHWNHLLYLEILIVKVKKLNKQLKIEGMKDNLQLEWSTNTLNTLLQLMTSLSKSKQQLPLNIPLADNTSNQASTPKSSQILSCISMDLLSIKFELTNVNVFVLNDYKVCLMLRTDCINVEHQQCKSSLYFNGLKLVYLHQQEPFQSLSRSVDLQKPVASIKEIRIVYKHQELELTVQVIKELLVVWTTHSHMCFYQGLQDAQTLMQKLRHSGYGELHKEEEEDKLSNINIVPAAKLQLNVLIHANVNLTAQISNQHEVTLHTDSILLTGKIPSCLMEINHLTMSFDTHEIYKLNNIVFETLSPSTLQRERQAVGNLYIHTNRTWGVSIESFQVTFPYNYNFSACFEEVVNTNRWLKLVHKIQKKPFTVDSKLPPDLRILVKLFVVQLSDDPFEVKLGDNYELLKDEYYESINRKSVLDAKITELQRQHGLIPASRVEDLYSSLARKSADIYIQRSKQYYNTAKLRSKLFTWTMKDVDITALADLSFHGKENVVKHMQEIDSESPYPAEGLEFSTLWCRSVSFSCNLWTVKLRDYPLDMLHVQDMHVWGRLIGAEQEAAKRAKRTCIVEVDKPWGDVKVERSLPPLKFFHDFSCDMKSLKMAYGVCWEAAFAQYNICLDMINKPSIDPSQPLPFWDKIRLLFHGRWTMSIGKMHWLYHAQFDPFNKNELMEWTWTNVVLDWTNGKFLLKGDLDISAKTESKYDDCIMFHLPNLRFCVRLEWLCVGNPNDHHSVMPCAPDKVPDYSMEEHDSFRAFRSEKLNLDISLETQFIKENPADIPSCYFYASTLRFMDKIKNCLLSTTRPIRRGKYFQTISKRKLQLSRHYKKIKMSVNFHQFLIRYWMSFAKQHGFEVMSDSFTLNMCNKLALRPIEDGLMHRPASEWSVYYLICNLGNTKTWLCQAMPHEGDDSLNMSIGGREEKSFFLSVASVTYKRGEKSKKKEAKDSETDQITPTHSVHVNELRGSWTKKNRAVLIGIYDSYQKAQSLRRNLSSEALKGFKVEGNQHGNKATSISSLVSGPPGSPVVATSPLSKLQTGHALSMLIKLVSESDSKSVVFTEEPSSSNMEQLHGVRACQTDDVVQKNWLIELDNSQIILKGCETSGYVIVSAAKAQILSCLHHPIWRNGQLRSKTTWVGSVECMQYYATVNPSGDFKDDDIPWLSKENVEDRFEADISGVPEMVGSGHSVGGVISNTVGPSDKSPDDTVQLQRIISRCKCQFFYANYGDLKPNELPEVPLPPTEESDVMEMEEGIDAFTILHHDLNMCSNPLQYTMILDIVNNLLLYVEPKEKEAKENLQSMRFRLELSRVEDQKTPILQLQEKVRSKALELRKHEKELHKLQKQLPEDSQSDVHLVDVSRDLQDRLNTCKTDLYKLNEELSIRISCYKESQLQVKQQMKLEKAQQADVVRRNEVCFKFAKWRLTEEYGQLGITDITLRNFVYTKVNRDDDTWTHLLEIGWVKMTNLFPDSIYKDVLIPRDPIEKENRQMTIRILCSERPPVGGIAVKEHFEVNVVPMQLQLTYHFYKAVMAFFFPDKNIETDDQEDDMDGQKKKADKRRESQREKERKDSAMKKSPSFTSTDKIDIMKMRAASNNSFLYIKIPELLVKVSYKGMKEKNIEDVHDFSFVLPTMECHNRIWTWFDVLMAAKNHSKRTLLSQAIKQKLHMKARSDEQPLTDVQQEEDKAKMLLGAKLLAGQDKPVKKSLFSKSHKS